EPLPRVERWLHGFDGKASRCFSLALQQDVELEESEISCSGLRQQALQQPFEDSVEKIAAFDRMLAAPAGLPRRLKRLGGEAFGQPAMRLIQPVENLRTKSRGDDRSGERLKLGDAAQIKLFQQLNDCRG